MSVYINIFSKYFRTEVRTPANSLKKRKLAISSTDNIDEPNPNEYFPDYNSILQDPSISDDKEFSSDKFLKEFSFADDKIMSELSSGLSASLSSTIPVYVPEDPTNITGTIKTYAPDCAPCREYTKVILQVTGFTKNKDSRYTFACQFANTEVPVAVTVP